MFRNKETTNQKIFQQFIVEVSKLEAIEFLGLTKIFCIKLEDDDRARTFEELLSDVLDGFLKLKRKQQKEILKVLKLSNLQKIEEPKDLESTEKLLER